METHHIKEDKPLEYYLECVRALPTIAVDDPRVLEAQQLGEVSELGSGYKHVQFGNNFYLLWLSVAPDVDSDSILRRVYANKAEALPEWTGFLDSNQELVTRLYTTLDEVYSPYQEIFHKFLDYLNDGDSDSLNAMRSAVDHPFKLDATCAYVWDQLNPVLEEAAEAMRKSGIEPEQFYS